MKASQEKNTQISYLTLFDSGAEYAFEVAGVKEIVVRPKVSSIPAGPENIKGVADYRGKVIPVIQPSRLCAKTAALKEPEIMLVVEIIKDNTVFMAGISAESPGTIIETDRQKNDNEAYFEFEYKDRGRITVINLKKILAHGGV